MPSSHAFPASPLLTTNRDERTLARTLREQLKSLRQKSTSPPELLIATGYFNAKGWFAVAAEIEKLPKIRLLVGYEQPLPYGAPQHNPFSNQPENRFQEQIRAIFLRHEKYLIQEYNEQPFEPQSTELWQNLPKALRKGNIEVRQYKKSFFHAKTWILKNTSATAGSSNLTFAGMNKNQEANVTLHNPELQQQLEEWYEQVWQEAENYDLAAVYDNLLEKYTPYDIYLKTLHECFHNEMEMEQETDSKNKFSSLTNFQKHGVLRAKRILQEYNGVLIADTVGLGKTFIAGAIMHDYLERRLKVLLIVPASMRTIWKNFLRKQHISEIVPISYEEFARDFDAENLQHEQELYQLVVIDEAHNYRNPDTEKRAKVLTRFLDTENPRDLVLLTATPVNNSITDLQTLFNYFLQDNTLATYKTPYPSLKALFRKLKKEENDGINTKRLEPLIDAVTLKRTRQFVQKEYPDAKLPDANGNLKPVTFPEVKLKTVRYNFDETLPNIFSELEDILTAKNKKPPKLTLAIYQVDKYLHNPKHDDGKNSTRVEPNIIGLIRSLLLKRFESSLHAFCRTIEGMCKKHTRFLNVLEEKRKVIKTVSKRPPPSDSDEEEWEKETFEPAEDYDDEALKKDIENDLQLLKGLADKKLEPKRDPKLKKLVEELANIAEQAERDSTLEREKKNNRKVLIFSYYKDTARWIHDFLAQTLPKDPRLSVYKGKNHLLYTSGSDDGANSTNPDKAALLFSPETSGTQHSSVPIEEECDILVATDVLSEGKNLQQCRHIISYDLPWNPMRLVQRHGRIDRLLSQHKSVFMRTFFPVEKLKDLFELENKVRKKLALANSTTGIEATPIEGGAESIRIYSERRKEIEGWEQGDASSVEKGRTRFDVKTAEEYRRTLSKALEDPERKWLERLQSMPLKMGSGKLAAKDGHFFCVKVDDHPQPFLRFVPSADPILTDFYDCLELLECEASTERVVSTKERKQAFHAWKQAQRSIVEEWNTFVKESSSQSRGVKINRDVADFLQKNPPPGVSMDELSQVIQKLRGTWRTHDEQGLKKIWKEKSHDTKRASQTLYDFVDKKNILTLLRSKRYERIEEDSVYLVCWMSLSKKIS